MTNPPPSAPGPAPSFEFEADDAGDPAGTLLRLQQRFLRTLAWLRRSSGLTQRALAEAAGWKQPYVARLEDERSPLIVSMARVERYAQACGATAVLVFVEKASGRVRRSLALGDDGAALAEGLRDARFTVGPGPVGLEAAVLEPGGGFIEARPQDEAAAAAAWQPLERS
ncbi:MAG: helix-turn-helix domain-containing protein [Burkholderiales bacterium]|nr:helix-turn-helix domain-containing protein [Burkholderiales bacterium]